MRAAIAAPVTALLVARAWYRKSLTPAGIAVAAATAWVHARHPWSVFFACLVVFFVGGTAVTKAEIFEVRHDVKARLTLSASGAAGGGEGARTHIQVLANSAVASVLVFLHARRLQLQAQQLQQQQQQSPSPFSSPNCWDWRKDVLVPGIIANYAAVAADTFASELGILSKQRPRLITSLTLRAVPPGTNGGVTLFGLLASLLGALTIAVTSAVLLPFCPSSSPSARIGSKPGSWLPLSVGAGTATITATVRERLVWIALVTLWGVLGSVVDSLLGGWLQASIVDQRTGKVVEGAGGRRVLVTSPPRPSPGSPAAAVASSYDNAGAGGADNIRSRPRHDNTRQPSSSSLMKQASRRLVSGRLDLLDNNTVNFVMALTMGLGAIVVAGWYNTVPIFSRL